MLLRFQEQKICLLSTNEKVDIMTLIDVKRHLQIDVYRSIIKQF